MHRKKSIFKELYIDPYKRQPVKLYSHAKGSKDLVQRLGLLKRLLVHEGCVNTLQWSSSGQYILSGSDDQHLIITNAFNYKVLEDYETSHRANIFSAKFLPQSNDRQIISCSGDGILLHTDLARPKQSLKNKFNCHDGTTYEIVTVPNDPNTFLSCGEDGTVRRFDLREKSKCSKKSCDADVLIRVNGAVTAMTLHPRASPHLAIGCSDSTVRVYDQRFVSYRNKTGGGTPEICRFFGSDLENRPYRITSLSYSADGEDILVSYSCDHLYLFSLRKREDKRFIKDPNETASSNPLKTSTSTKRRMVPAPVRRLRLRGDWSDTGPDARPEREASANTSVISQARSQLQTSLMQRMTDVLSRMLNDPMTRAALSGGGEDSLDQESSPTVAAEASNADNPTSADNSSVEASAGASTVAGGSISGPSVQGSNVQASNVQASNAETSNVQASNVQASNVDASNVDASNANVLSTSNENTEDSSKIGTSEASTADISSAAASNADTLSQGASNMASPSTSLSNMFDPSSTINISLVTPTSTCPVGIGVLPMQVDSSAAASSNNTPASSCSDSNQSVSSNVNTSIITRQLRNRLSILNSLRQGFIEQHGAEPSVSLRYSDQSTSNSTISLTGNYASEEAAPPPLPQTTAAGAAMNSDAPSQGENEQAPPDVQLDYDDFEEDRTTLDAAVVGRNLVSDSDLNDFYLPEMKKKYLGHRNARTMIKEATFWGDDYVMSGSDCGHVFVWDRESTELVMLLQADDHVVNCLQPHPTLPYLATSGIDHDIKIWAPILEDNDFDEVQAHNLMKRNAIMLEETKDTITVPAAFMIRMLASLNQIRHGRRSRREEDTTATDN